MRSCLSARNRLTPTAIHLLCRLSHRRRTRQRPDRYSRNHRNRRFILPILTIYRLVAKGTIEERIVALHHHKRDLAERLLEGADAPARLDAGELLELLRKQLD